MNLAVLSQFTQFGRVFPLGERSKKPMSQWRWTVKNSDDLAVIAQWLHDYPQANWALIPIRAIVIDVDCKAASDGSQSIQSAGGLTPTFRVKTPSGGSHHYYAPQRDLPFATRNSWLPGVDVRYGDAGYVVLPYSITPNGRYTIELDIDQLEGVPSNPSVSILLDPPDWIKSRWIQDASRDRGHTDPLPPEVEYMKCDRWGDIRDQVRFMFFRKKDNRRIWNHLAVEGMQDRSQSGFENQLAIRLMNVGATDKEVSVAYRAWCNKHNLAMKERFSTHVLPDARLYTAPYVAKWTAMQPVRRKHGTSASTVIRAIESGSVNPKDIVEATGLRDSTIRMQLKRLLAAGKLRKTGSGYSIAHICRTQDNLLAA